MPSEYPILDDRPIDQWKVTELKEELRRRKLATKGLKEELVKRLDEAIRTERELLEEKELDSSVDPELEPHDKDEEKDPDPTEISQIEEDADEAAADDERKTPENEVTMVEVDDGIRDGGQETEVQDESTGTVDLDGVVEERVAPAVTTEGKGDLSPAVTTEGDISPAVTTEGDLSHVEVTISKPEEDGEDLRDVSPAVTTEGYLSHVEVTISKPEEDGEDLRDDVENGYTKPPIEDTTTNLSEPDNQVSEVSHDLGSQVKCESISTDSVSINEKIELKENLNANNFHLELEVGNPEMVQPSSSDVPEMVQPSSSDVAPVAGDFNPLDTDQEPEDNRVSVEEIHDVANTTSLDLIKKIDNSNGGSPEKLNLDRSSGDESMEEDVLDTKQSESCNNYDEVGDMREVRELHVVKEGTPIDAVVGGFSPDKKDIVDEEDKPVVPAEKRKLEDQGSLGTTEPVKRQRRWNAETIKIPEPQTSNQISSTTPKDTFQSTPTPRRIFTRTDSGLSNDSPKERFVPPSPKTATTSLRIDRFLRPFTLKAVQELLAKTGTVCSFWMDHIKTHCYVTYSSVEEAAATRNALYNLQWPPNGGRLLTADFVDPQEVKMHVEAPQPPATPGGSSTAAPPPAPPPFERPNTSQPPLQSNRQQPPPPPALPQPPPASQSPQVRERERLPPPPPPPKKPEPPVLTLDDLFKKTRATPRIYYLPLSEEQVAAKRAAQGRSTRV